jgi:hypothetical protein
MNQTTTQLTITPLRPLGREESKQDIDMWWTKVKIHLKGTIYKDVMLKTWTAKEIDENRGFTAQTQTPTDPTPKSASEMSTLVGDMLEQILTLVPEITQTAVLGKATSLQWLYDQIRLNPQSDQMKLVSI